MSFENQPRVAVIVPVYNVANYLTECLDSIFAQTYTNYSVIAVNDGSTDQSGKILDVYSIKDPRLTVIYQANAGPGVARNAALDYIETDGTFEYVAFVDSDDMVKPDFLFQLVKEAKRAQADIVITGLSEFNDLGRLRGYEFSNPAKVLDKEEFVELIFSRLRWKDSNGAGGMVWKQLFSTASLKGIRFSLDREIVEDELFCLQVLTQAKKISYIPKPLYLYRHRNNSLVKNNLFLLRLLKGREKCLSVSKELSYRSFLIVISVFSELIVDLMVYHTSLTFGDRLNIKLKHYKKYVIEAEKHNLISKKTLVRFILFCDHPFLVKVYLLNKRIIKSIKDLRGVNID